ncbi:MAG: hypothetical protein IJ172_10035 [Ruminococcus sp.]|nr:hypothetical protein [Ruminococcus sp.]
MNQEKIMKRKMITAIIWSFIMLIALLVFIGLYIDKSKEITDRFRSQYKQSIADAADEIDTYLDTKVDYDMHYKMLISNIGAARSFIFLLEEDDDKKNNMTENQKAVNELHYCLVKYPEQMETKIEDVSKALHDVYDNLDKGYDEMRAIVDSVNKMGK